MKLCPLFSGSSGNSTYLECGKKSFLIDAGMPAKHIENALALAGSDMSKISGILITHEHIDHVRGVGVLARRYRTPIYANEATFKALPSAVGNIPESCLRYIASDCDFFIGDARIQPFRTPHDATESVGYTIFHGGAQASVLTDIGHVTDRLLSSLYGSRLVLIESNHDVDMLRAGPYPYELKRRILGNNGHLSNKACGQALVRLYKSGVRMAILGHLSAENNHEQLAYETVREILRAEDIYDERLHISVAHRDRPLGIFEL
ncbi:MAG: MBL fold metallo-hydrolase [Clostridia bacterium]|nr:MBL fold metallo-hydrolase [Clostridia bacterium]